MKPDKLTVGQTILSSYFNEPVRIKTLSRTNESIWQLGVIGGLQTDRFRKVTFISAKIDELRMRKTARYELGELLRDASDHTLLLTAPPRRRDCYWRSIATNCGTEPVLREPIRDPAGLQWHEARKIGHYYLNRNTIAGAMRVSEAQPPYGAANE